MKHDMNSDKNYRQDEMGNNFKQLTQMPNIQKGCPGVRHLKISHYTVKKWGQLHESLDLPVCTTESVKTSVPEAVTHTETLSDCIPPS